MRLGCILKSGGKTAGKEQIMEFREQSFIPVIFGGDINTYSVARAFYNAYRVRSYTFGKFPTGPSYRSRIITYTANQAIDEEETFLKTITDFAEKHKDKKLMAIGCGDSYVALLSRLKDRFPENVIAPYSDYDLLNRLQQKDLFYQLCEKHGLDYPATVVFTPDMDPELSLPFGFPLILKPANPITYWEHPFDTQEKVYTISDRENLIRVIGEIYGAGYTDNLILQDMIPGNDEYMRVLTCYSDKNAQVKMQCLGHVLLEEHTPHGKGNHAVIITEKNEELMGKVKALLEDLHYIGFSNFDIKYDQRDGKYKFFEINTRQGRSNYYVAASGINISRFPVEEYIHNKPLEYTTSKREALWLVVPAGVAKKYIHEKENKAKLKQLLKEKKYVNPVFMKGDNKPNRMIRMLKNHMSHYKKYKTYYQ